MTRGKRRLDQALHDRAELLARAHPLGVVAEILGLQASQITEMRKRGWKALEEGAPRRRRPTDFEWTSATMTHAQLCAHYSAGHRTVQRWFAETRNPRPSWKGDSLRANPRRGGAAKKTVEEMAAIRAKQWEVRRAKYGPRGYRAGAYARAPRRDVE